MLYPTPYPTFASQGILTATTSIIGPSQAICTAILVYNLRFVTTWMSRIKHPNQRMRTLWALLAASETVNNVAHWLVAYYLAPVNPALIYIVFSQLHNFDTLMMIPLRMRIVSFILRCTKMDGRINRWVIIFCPIIVRMIFLVAWLGVYLATGNAVLGPIALICSEGFNATMDSIMAQYVALGARTGEVPSADEALRGLFVDADLLLHLGVSGALGIVFAVTANLPDQSGVAAICALVTTAMGYQMRENIVANLERWLENIHKPIASVMKLPGGGSTSGHHNTGIDSGHRPSAAGAHSGLVPPHATKRASSTVSAHLGVAAVATAAAAGGESAAPAAAHGASPLSPPPPPAPRVLITRTMSAGSGGAPLPLVPSGQAADDTVALERPRQTAGEGLADLPRTAPPLTSPAPGPSRLNAVGTRHTSRNK